MRPAPPRVAALVLAAVLPLAHPSVAADLSVSVRGDDGTALADAVVVVHPAGGFGPMAAVRYSWPLTMAQQNIAFNPYVLIVPLGSTVGFPNRDKVRHHVYSFSAVKKFELKLYGQQDERTVTFDKPGIVALGCNIHDSMIGFIYVADSPFAAKTNAAGEAVIHGLPTGGAQISVWHPDMKAKAPVSQSASLTATTVKAMVLELRPPATRHRH